MRPFVVDVRLMSGGRVTHERGDGRTQPDVTSLLDIITSRSSSQVEDASTAWRRRQVSSSCYYDN